MRLFILVLTFLLINSCAHANNVKEYSSNAEQDIVLRIFSKPVFLPGEYQIILSNFSATPFIRYEEESEKKRGYEEEPIGVVDFGKVSQITEGHPLNLIRSDSKNKVQSNEIDIFLVSTKLAPNQVSYQLLVMDTVNYLHVIDHEEGFWHQMLREFDVVWH